MAISRGHDLQPGGRRGGARGPLAGPVLVEKGSDVLGSLALARTLPALELVPMVCLRIH